MNHYLYTLVASLFLIGQITFVNQIEGIPDDRELYAEAFSFDQAVDAVDEDELIISYVFNDTAEYDKDCSEQLITVGQARDIVARAHLEKYGVDYIFGDDDVHLDSLVTRFEFAKLFYPLCAAETHINVCEYITDIEQSNELYDEISTLYKVGIIAGNSEYGHFSGYSNVTASTAKVMINRLYNPEERVTFSPALKNQSFALELSCVKQNPELPTGCEVTSLTTVLNYYGFDADKMTMANMYLDKGDVGTTNPSVAFVGSPDSTHSYGCYSPVIERCADKYLSEKQSSLATYRLSDVSFRNLLLEVEQGHPVIVWASMYMKETYSSAVWNIDGESVAWIANEHCLVLYGYDLERGVVMVADPLVGNTEYNIELFETRYNELMKQAVVIK